MGRVPQDDAQKVIDDIDYTKPWNNKAEFIAAVAALVALHKADCDVSTTQKGRTVRHLFSAMCTYRNLEYLFSNLRVRHALPFQDDPNACRRHY